MQVIVERISGTEYTLEALTLQSKNANCKMSLTTNIQETQDTIFKPNLRIICNEESEDSQLKSH